MLSFPIHKTQNREVHDKILSQISDRLKWAIRSQQRMHPEWNKAEDSMNAYVPPTAADERRASRRDAGDPQYTTMVIPYSFAVVMAAHTYFTSVMLARNPIHQFQGINGQGQTATDAVQSLLQYQVSMGAAMVPYYSWLYDGCRIGHGIVRTCWEKETRQVASIVEVDGPTPGADPLFGEMVEPNKPRRMLRLEEVETYEGNKVANVSPFDFLPDPRVPLQRYQDGEYCGHRIRNVSWNTIKDRERQGYYMNTQFIKTSTGTLSRGEAYGETSTKEKPDEYNFSSSEGDFDNQHPSVADLYEVYVHCIPSEFKLGSRDRPELWCFTITADLSLLLGATPVGYYHCRFPYDVVKLDLDAYSSFARGIPRLLESVQATMDWQLNTHFYNIRAALQNLFVADTSRIRLTDLEDPLPGGIIRARMEAAGQDVRTAIHQIPINDVTKQHVQELPFMQAIGERITGVNDTVMAAESGSNRKTATEVRTNSGFAVNRMKTSVEFMSHHGMGPHAIKMLQNTQQFYSGEKKLLIAGDAMQFAPGIMDITPQAIAGQYQFVHIDGTMPSDRLAEAKLMQELLMQITQFPQIAQSYDIGRMVLWALSRAGLRNAEQFKIQTAVLPDEQVQAQTQRGNIIPIPPRTPASRGIAPSLGNADGASGAVV